MQEQLILPTTELSINLSINYTPSEEEFITPRRSREELSKRLIMLSSDLLTLKYMLKSKSLDTLKRRHTEQRLDSMLPELPTNWPLPRVARNQ